ncbi:MAG: UDP-N-acetylmuramoyl-L-alanine--D-glutamate ligase [Pseudolabrys sp.]|jgi:UDP-N-acetylmuramoylalanine--D-glutamate ligase|nr:UDP-N-acetylmuramoyl-L-alanine--D-glutamate ligase [Pseudolabrys sp.]
MIPVTVFAGRTVAVFGLGGSGLASARALQAGGATVVCFDDSAARIEDAKAAGLPTNDLRATDWSGVAALVLAPGVPLTHPKPHWVVDKARDNDVEVIGDIELFCRERGASGFGCPFVAITGTNGKSTTTALTAHLLRSAGLDVQMGGNIGVPILALAPLAQDRVYVIEVSSYQVDLAPSLKPTVGVLLNISADHLDRHGTMENYAALKALVPAAVEPGGVAIVGVDDAWSRAAAERVAGAGRPVVQISATHPLRDGYYADGSRIVHASGGKTDVVAQLAGIGSLRGAHNAQNAAAAIAVARRFGLDPAAIQQALTTFPGLPHRMEEVGRRGKSLYINDSKATNADSAARALASFHDIFWIAGGKPKTGGITPLAEYFPRIRKAYLIGEAAQEFAATLEGKVPYEISGAMPAAVEAASRDAAASDAAEPVVLLSPACASFDQYKNFEVRGAAFRDIVLGLPGVVPKS